MPYLFTNNDRLLEGRIKNFMNRKMEEHPDLKTTNIKDITDYIEY